MVFGIPAGIHLLLQSQETEVARLVRSETGYLHVIAQEIGILGDRVVLAGEKLLLIVETGSPGEIRADLQVFAEAVAHHVRGMHAFGRIAVVRASSGVDVMVTRTTSPSRRDRSSA